MAKKEFDRTDIEYLRTIHSDEYKAYLAALCRLASMYVSRIRVQFAERAYENYADPTIRRMVLAYGDEAEKLDRDRLSDFRHVSEYGADDDAWLKDSCLNNASAYAKAIWFLFDIDNDKEGKKDDA